MKNIFKQSALAILFMATISCSKDEEKTVMTPSDKPVLLTPAEGNNLILEKIKASDLATTVVWDHALYQGSSTVVNYDVELVSKKMVDNKEVEVVTVAGKTTSRFLSLTVAELNNTVLNAGLPASKASSVVLRLKSYIGDAGLPQYSNSITLNVTPYPSYPIWSIIGSAAAGWSTDTPLNYDFSTKEYSLELDLKAGEFKYRLESSWDHNLGGTDLSVLTHNGSNLVISEDGKYLLTLKVTEDTTVTPPVYTGITTITKK